MRYFFPDSQDLVDPSFDFSRETRSIDRIRQRDDLYAHEVFSSPAYDGILVSKGIVDGSSGGLGRYSIAQRQRLLRRGVQEFFRLERAPNPLAVMGDCGAFTYVKEKVPPYTVDEVIEFYVECDFDYGISVDHVILGFKERWDEDDADLPNDYVDRQALTLELAAEFWSTHKRNKLRFEPMGVAQGWSPQSYAASVKALQEMGYRYVAVGGMVPLKTDEIVATLQGISAVRKKGTKLHLLGITRLEKLETFQQLGAVSFDSTSPLRQAFKDEKHNYYTPDGAFCAVRLPQVEANPRLKKRIRSGEVENDQARRLERKTLTAMADFDAGDANLDEVVDVLVEYESLLGQRKDHTETYRRVLEARPWKSCRCDVCEALGYHVILFRGAERNRRRGFHNTWVFYQRLQRLLAQSVHANAKPAKRRAAN